MNDTIRLDLTRLHGRWSRYPDPPGMFGRHDDAQNQQSSLSTSLDDIHSVEMSVRCGGVGPWLTRQFCLPYFSRDGAAIESGGMAPTRLVNDVGGRVLARLWPRKTSKTMMEAVIEVVAAAALGVEHRGDSLAGLGAHAVQINQSGKSAPWPAAVGQRRPHCGRLSLASLQRKEPP